MRFALAICMAAVVTMLGLPAQAKTTSSPVKYTPQQGVIFNNPVGTVAAKRKAVNHIINSINSAPRGSTIRVAVYSFADMPTANALIAAHKRGVGVKVITRTNFPAVVKMKKALGTSIMSKSFVKLCTNSCRGPANKGEMHAKYFSFTISGSARYVTMVGSVNLTGFNFTKQWNDLYTSVNDVSLFTVFSNWFEDMKYDTPRGKTFINTGTTTGYGVQMTPLGKNPDPMMTALSTVKCPKKNPSTIRIAMHAWNESRGSTLANRVANLSRAGCKVNVVAGKAVGLVVKKTLRAGGVRVVESSHPGVFTHQKLMMVSGKVEGKSGVTYVWTGSSNWSERAYPRDDIILKITDQKAAKSYVAGFNKVMSSY